MFIVAPAVLAFVGLAFADTFLIVCALFFFLSFIFGLKDAPATIYVSEVSEPSVCIQFLSIYFAMPIESNQIFIEFLFAVVGARYIVGHFRNCETIRLRDHLFAGNVFNMASGGIVHCSSAHRHCHCDLLHPRNSELAAVKRSTEGRTTIVAMATRLG